MGWIWYLPVGAEGGDKVVLGLLCVTYSYPILNLLCHKTFDATRAFVGNQQERFVDPGTESLSHKLLMLLEHFYLKNLVGK